MIPDCFHTYKANPNVMSHVRPETGSFSDFNKPGHIRRDNHPSEALIIQRLPDAPSSAAAWCFGPGTHLVRIEEGVEADGGQGVPSQTDPLRGFLQVHDLVQLVRVLQLWQWDPVEETHTDTNLLTPLRCRS